MSHTLVLDVGKTHIKLHLLNFSGESVFSRRMHNRIIGDSVYPHADTEGIWQWLLGGVETVAAHHSISAISISTHGATAALIDRQSHNGGLVLPVLDYEYSGIEQCDHLYNPLRPDFNESYSPRLPAGLNLGRQLHWQQRMFPQAFSRATDILMYPQYWGWRLTGSLCSEVTSLGCHTDLWAPQAQDFSSLVDNMGWRRRFPPLAPAWTDIGAVRPELAARTGLPVQCRVYAGIHDSNASFLRYRLAYGDSPFTVISTGTWSILMASGLSDKKLSSVGLDEHRDTLVNADVFGNPVACARFMGGREYEAVCRLAGANGSEHGDEGQLQALIDAGAMALPDFSAGSGPFPGRRGRLLGQIPPGCGAALAALYCALMLDYQLDMVGARGDIFIEGAFLKNSLLCAVLAQLRGTQKVWLSSDDTGTVQGCASLCRWGSRGKGVELTPSGVTQLENLDRYRNHWRTNAESGPVPTPLT